MDFTKRTRELSEEQIKKEIDELLKAVPINMNFKMRLFKLQGSDFVDMGVFLSEEWKDWKDLNAEIHAHVFKMRSRDSKNWPPTLYRIRFEHYDIDGILQVGHHFKPIDIMVRS